MKEGKEMTEIAKNDKAKFIENIQKWVILDSQNKVINQKIKDIRTSKHKLLEEINAYVSENNIQNTTIEISDGELRFCEKKTYQPITFRYIEETLHKIINDEKHIEYIMLRLRENRETIITKDIRRI